MEVVLARAASGPASLSDLEGYEADEYNPVLRLIRRASLSNSIDVAALRVPALEQVFRGQFSGLVRESKVLDADPELVLRAEAKWEPLWRATQDIRSGRVPADDLALRCGLLYRGHQIIGDHFYENARAFWWTVRAHDHEGYVLLQWIIDAFGSHAKNVLARENIPEAFRMSCVENCAEMARLIHDTWPDASLRGVIVSCYAYATKFGYRDVIDYLETDCRDYLSMYGVKESLEKAKPIRRIKDTQERLAVMKRIWSIKYDTPPASPSSEEY